MPDTEECKKSAKSLKSLKSLMQIFVESANSAESARQNFKQLVPFGGKKGTSEKDQVKQYK